MREPLNAFEFIEELRKQSGKKENSFRTLARYLDDKAREKGVPVHGQFELTPLCNFSCKMCYVHLDAAQLSGRKVLPVETWKDLMHQAWEAGMLRASLTGGECLAYPGFDELFLYLHSLGCEVSVLTNGFLLDDRRIEFFRQHMPAEIQVTLYGWNDDVYERVTGQRAFGTVAANVRKAIGAGLPVHLTVTPSSFLGEDVLETVRLAKSITPAFSVSAGLFPPREETGRSRQWNSPDADLYLRIYKLLNELDGRELKEIDPDRLPPVGGSFSECGKCGLQCGGGRSAFVMNWEGDVTPCNRLSVIRASALKEGFREAWARVNRAAESWPRIPECKGCAYRNVCNVCAAAAFHYTGEPGKQPAGLCETIRYYVQHGIMSIPECED